MDRLILGVIAVIGLHTAFVLYMANVRHVEKTEAPVRRAPAVTRPERIIAKPSVETELQTSITPPALENAPGVVLKRNTDRERPRSGAVSSFARFEPRAHRPPTGYSAKPIPAYPLRTASVREGSKKFFGDYVVVYKTDISRPTRGLAAVSRSTGGDNCTPKPRNKSLTAKLQVVYEKPWGLIKAVGSKLR